jgi:hypothetical protein
VRAVKFTQNLIRYPEEKRLFGKSIKVTLERWEDVHWSNAAQDNDQRWILVKMVMNLWLP